MFRKLLILFPLVVILPILVCARSVEFHLEVPDRYYHSYEEIPAIVSIGNYESFSKNITLIVEVGQRKVKYDYYDVKPNQQIRETVILPAQIPGRHVVKGRLYYEDDLKNAISESVPDDIEVLFPQEIKSYPKMAVVASFELPPNIYGGKSYIVKSNIENKGDLETNVSVELGSYDEFESTQITLKPGEIKTVDLNVTFYSTGISFIESRIYYLDGDHKYLINFAAKETVVTDEKIADLRFQSLELFLESNQEINQNDEVKLKVNLFNKGKFPAFNATGYLSANVQGLAITKNIVDYGTISPKLISGGHTAEDYFEIKTINAPVQEAFFNFSIHYIDNEDRIREYTVPFTIFEGDDTCLMNWDCKEGFFCNQEGTCQELICDCGEKTEHRCINPTDAKCPSDKKCNYYGVCEKIPCECGELVGHKCMLADDDKCPNNKRCDVEGQCTDIFCPEGEIKEHECDYKCRSDSECGEGEICNEYSRCDLGCRKDSDCPSNKKCNEYDFCEEIPCECGEVIDKQCRNYDCCNNFDCGEFEVCSSTIHKCLAQTGCIEVIKNGDPKDKLDIVYVGAWYDTKEFTKFKQDVKLHVENMLSIDPFNKFKNRINVYLVNKFEDMGCQIYGDRCLSCDGAKVTKIASDCPYDKIIVLADTDRWAGCAGLGGIANAASAYPFISLHEFGHSFGMLWDEYSYGGNGSKETVKDAPNCDYSPNCEKWSNIPNTGCFKECHNDNLYRSIDAGIMRQESKDFGVVDKIQLTNLLEKYS